MKSAFQILQACLVISGLVLAQAACAVEKRASRSPASVKVSLLSPKWSNSLHGYSNLNLSRGQISTSSKVTDADFESKADHQIGPILVNYRGRDTSTFVHRFISDY